MLFFIFAFPPQHPSTNSSSLKRTMSANKLCQRFQVFNYAVSLRSTFLRRPQQSHISHPSLRVVRCVRHTVTAERRRFQLVRLVDGCNLNLTASTFVACVSSMKPICFSLCFFLFFLLHLIFIVVSLSCAPYFSPPIMPPIGSRGVLKLYAT